MLRMLGLRLYGEYGMRSVFFFQAEDGIRDGRVTGVQTCALPIFRNPSMMKTRAPGTVIRTSRHHFPTMFGGAITRAVYGRPAERTWIAESAMSVLPVPHSAMTAAALARCQRFTMPITARR